jgi:transcriptional regulator with XRE-family HTH domain
MTYVGQKIKEIREKKNMTLRHLANLVNTSASFLSQVETGKALPSLSTLKRLADSLDTTIGMLADDENDTDKQSVVLHRENRIRIDKIGHDIEVTILSPKKIDNQLQAYYVLFNPNSDTGEFNKHVGQEWGIVVDGEITMYIESDKYIICKDDCFYYNAMLPHFFKNASKTESALVLFVSVPPLF